MTDMVQVAVAGDVTDAGHRAHLDRLLGKAA